MNTTTSPSMLLGSRPRSVLAALLAATSVGCSPGGRKGDDSSTISRPPAKTSQGGAGGDSDAGTGGALFTFGGAGGSTGVEDAGASEDAGSVGCGNGRIETGEACDDGNSAPGDGCSANCDRIENDFVCPGPGQPCLSTLACGDGRIGGTETCDDGNLRGGDGCSDACDVEAGWTCPAAGSPCEAVRCGDGLLAGIEQCEDGDVPPLGGDGCNADCEREPGYACDSPGSPCRATVCGDGVKEGSEPCDDGNSVIGDGCSPFCEVEPSCALGACSSACGDGMILPGDTDGCDDANTAGGDGCSASCAIELGWTCRQVAGVLPDTLDVAVTFRDFNRAPTAGNTQHPDFETFGGSDPTPGLVSVALGANGKPVYTGICQNGAIIGPCPYGAQTTSQAFFDQWYSNQHPPAHTLVTRLSLARVAGTSAYRTAPGSLFPLDGAGLVGAGMEQASGGHNFGFTSEIRSWFEFQGGETLDFSGDDDVWVFVAGQLVLDLGGLHPRRQGGFTLNPDGSASWTRPGATGTATLGLQVGRVYEIVLFHAERHTGESNFELTLGGFVSAKSECESICGDGIVVGRERCDDGVNDGSYGSCLPDCSGRGPHCGDGNADAPHEVCDDGVNLMSYSQDPADGCAPGCTEVAYCGDGNVDSAFGEQCDDGENRGDYDGCKADCTLGPRCGDGKIQAGEGETCDDDNRIGGDGCSARCVIEAPQ